MQEGVDPFRKLFYQRYETLVHVFGLTLWCFKPWSYLVHTNFNTHKTALKVLMGLLFVFFLLYFASINPTFGLKASSNSANLMRVQVYIIVHKLYCITLCKTFVNNYRIFEQTEKDNRGSYVNLKIYNLYCCFILSVFPIQWLGRTWYCSCYSHWW